MVKLPDLTTWERMIADYGLLGLSPSYHPFGLLRPRLPKGIFSAARLRDLPDGCRVWTAGLVVCRQRPQTAKGFLFLLLEDETGITNVVVRPALYEAKRSLIRGNPYLCVNGIVQLRSDTLNLIATHLRPLANIPPLFLPPPPTPATPPSPDAPVASPDAPPSPDPTRPATLSDLLLATPGSHDFH